MIEFIDIYPTMAELMNLNETPDYLEGKSFASVVDNPKLPFKEQVYAVTKRGDIMGRMVKNNEWRYIEWDKGKHGAELYDQKNDPSEHINQAENAKYASVVAEMKVILNEK